MSLTDDVVKWTAEAIRTISERIGVPLPPIPGPPPVAAPEEVTFQSGIVVRGAARTEQRGRLRALPGAVVAWSGGTARLGMSAAQQLISCPPLPVQLVDGTFALEPIPYHTQVPPLASGRAMQDGDRILICCPRQRRQKVAGHADDPIFLEEAVLVECGNPAPTPGLHSLWPRSIQGATRADVDYFLSLTPFVSEQRVGWSGRYSHPRLNWPDSGEEGYGGDFAEITGLGALLLCSTVDNSAKQEVQNRLMLMAHDVELHAIPYPADGGHGNGRYILWLIRRMLGGLTSNLAPPHFSECVQVYRRPSGELDWRMNQTSMSSIGDGSDQENYRYCCTANRWIGGAIAAGLMPALLANPDWVAYTQQYLRQNLPKVGTASQWHVANDGATLRLILANLALLAP